MSETRRSATLVGDPTVGEKAIAHMRQNGGVWWAYQNHDMGHQDLGRLAFLMTGPGCTFQEPPRTYPDTEDVGLGWRYSFVGCVDVERGVIVEQELPDGIHAHERGM